MQVPDPDVAVWHRIAVVILQLDKDLRRMLLVKRLSLPGHSAPNPVRAANEFRPVLDDHAIE